MAYLGHYVTVGTPDSDECAENLLQTCSFLVTPVAPNKTEDPTPVTILLGNKIDSINQQLRLPKETLARALKLLCSWFTCVHSERCSTHASIFLEGIFLRRIYDATASLSKSHHHIRLNANVHSDIAW